MSIAQEFKEIAVKGNVIDLAVGVICGLGAQGYELALQAALTRIGRS